MEAAAKAAEWAETTAISWSCKTCNRDCVGVGPASRCICNHRLSEHKEVKGRYVCAQPKCPCRQFFYHVTTGSWNCRCRCKHKHTDHDCSKPPYKCTKPGPHFNHVLRTFDEKSTPDFCIFNRNSRK